MNNYFCTPFTFFLLIRIVPVLSCPTCIGLPRPGERPFFERKAFLAIVKPPTKKSALVDKKMSPSVLSPTGSSTPS